MEGLEEEDELEVLGNLLESVANRGDCEEPWDVEEEGQDNDGKHMGEGDESGGAIAGSLLGKYDNLEDSVRPILLPNRNEESRQLATSAP